MKGGAFCQHPLDHIERPLVIITLGVVASHLLYRRLRIGHGEAIAGVRQHFDIVAAVACCHHLDRKSVV